MGTVKKFDILLVDDREENLLALESVLDSPEFNLVKAKSGDEALRSNETSGHIYIVQLRDRE